MVYSNVYITYVANFCLHDLVVLPACYQRSNSNWSVPSVFCAVPVTNSYFLCRSLEITPTSSNSWMSSEHKMTKTFISSLNIWVSVVMLHMGRCSNCLSKYRLAAVGLTSLTWHWKGACARVCGKLVLPLAGFTVILLSPQAQLAPDCTAASEQDSTASLCWVEVTMFDVRGVCVRSSITKLLWMMFLIMTH